MKIKRHIQNSIACALVLGGTFTPAFASDFDVYIQSIESGSEAQRVTARQMLSREGVRAVPALIELMQHEDQLVWRNARNILADICNHVSAPGFDADRVTVTDQLVALVQAEATPPHAVQEGLRLLSIAMPKGYSLESLEALMEQPAYRGEVISALVVMNTSEARALLEKTEAISPLNEQEALDIQIENAEQLILNGGNWDAGIRIYREALQVMFEYMRGPKIAGIGPTITSLGPAITGLGRFGDETVIPVIMGAVKANPELQAPALMGLDSMFGLAAYEGLLAAYSGAGLEMQLGLLSTMGRKQDGIFLPLLLENAASDDAARQKAAFGALVQSDLPGGADAVVKYVTSRPADDRRFEVMDLLAYADRLHNKGAGAGAGKAYLGLYKTASHQDDKDIAFHGIKEHPSPEAYDIILSDIDLENLDEVPVETLIALNVMLKKDVNAEAFAKIRKALGESVKSTQQVQSVLDMAGQQGATEQFLPLLGFVQNWHVLGPFPWTMGEAFTANPIGAPTVDLAAKYTVDGKDLAWRKHRSGQITSCDGLFGSLSNVTMYAYATIHSDTATAAQLRVGSDDGVRVWLNGESVHENNENRGVSLDADVVNVTLKQGANTLLLQVTQGAGGWAYTCRITKPDGVPIKQ